MLPNRFRLLFQFGKLLVDLLLSFSDGGLCFTVNTLSFQFVMLPQAF